MEDHPTHVRQRRDDGLLRAILEIKSDIAEVKQTTSDLKRDLMGPPEQPWLGFVPRIEVRVGSLETRFWLAALGVISALLGTGWALLGKH